MTAIDVGPRAGGRLGLGGVLVDVAGGDDHVDVGLERLAELADELFAAAADGVDAGDALGGKLAGARLDRRAPLGRHGAEGEFAGGDALGDLLGALAGLQHEVDERPHDAAGQQFAGVLDDDVDERHVDVVHAAHAQQTQRGAFGRVGRVLFDVPLDVVGDGVGGLPRATDERLVQLDHVVHCHTVLGWEAATGRRPAVAAGRHGGQAVDDVEDGRAVADCVGDRAEEDLGL